MRSSPRARAAFLLLYGALVAWQIDRWSCTPHGLVSSWSGRHDARAVSAASADGIFQTFTMGADGLDGVWLRPVASGQPHGDLVVDLVQVTGGARVRLQRVALPASGLTSRRSLHVPFRPTRASRGVQYALALRHLHAEGGPPVTFAVTRDDLLPGARLFADGVEQWGDLAFETSSGRATLPYWIHEVLRPWPGWARAWPTVVLGLLLFNGVLAWACAVAVGLVGAWAGSVEMVPLAGSRDRAAHAGAVSVATLVTVLVAAAGVVVAARPTGRYRSLDLLEALPDARIESSRPSLHEGVALEPVAIFGRVHRAIVALPTSVIRWDVQVPRGAVLRFGAAMRPDMWTRESDGIQMRVLVEQGETSTPVAEYTIVPMLVELHKRLHPGEVPLDRWAGQRVTVVFETTPERWGNAVNDVPVWVAPRIEWPRDPAAGGAAVVRR